VKKNPAVDAYIAKSADFAKPILTHIREVVHAAVPEVEEEMKWSTPNFMYKGMLCGMAAFKQHCAVGFWKGSLIRDAKGNPLTGDSSAGSLGRITSLGDLPSDKVLTGYIKQAAKLNDHGVTAPREKTKPKTDLVVPPYFTTALKKNKKALANFDALSPSHRKEYVEWLTDAKTDETRNKRLATAVEWIADGKSRNWKYERK
jgi:uncharacterized protein YdeI (YjbR/CyaY-like superfamily)